MKVYSRGLGVIRGSCDLPIEVVQLLVTIQQMTEQFWMVSHSLVKFMRHYNINIRMGVDGLLHVGQSLRRLGLKDINHVPMRVLY